MIQSRVVAQTADGPMTARVWHPSTVGPHPVVVCYHDGPGLRECIYETARRIAEDGYYVAVPDLYHREGEEISFDLAEVMNPDSPERERFDRVIGSTTPEQMVGDSLALVEAVRGDAAAADGPFGCVGFCHTARTVIGVMAGHGDIFTAGAMLHPAFTVTDSPDSPHLRVKDITGEVYAAFGGADAVVPLPQQQPLIMQLEQLGEQAVIEVHAKGGHGFLWPGTPSHDPEGAAAAWTRMFELFGRRLKGSAVPAG
ncbi:MULTISPECIES: dienelactone hydrolase family protein [unclassified Streptomyces]|uniref:dienelactone hydrolase family protein n=1 Tax=unclassified Streptomyces TaxID=2593676 RepID=UPI0036F02CF4